MADDDRSLERIISALGSKTGVGTEGEHDFYSRLVRQSEETESLADRENKGIIGMRRIWSTWTLIFIGIIVIFDIILVSFYGLDIWDFKDPNVVIVVVTENFLKIIGLGLLITNSLFKKIF